MAPRGVKVASDKKPTDIVLLDAVRRKGFTERCNTKVKMLKCICYGLRNVDLYWKKMLLGLYYPVAISTLFDKEPPVC